MQPSVHSVQTAKGKLSELIEAALRGVDVVIAKCCKSSVRLVLMPQSGFRVGVTNGKLDASPSFLEPMTEE